MSGRSRRLGILGGVVVATAGVALWVAFDETSETVRELEPDRPVVLIHGYGGAPGSMRVLERRLELAGRDAIPVQLPHDGTGRIRASAARVARAVRAYGRGRVDVVGFSAGGIVARVYVDDFGGARRVVNLVMLGAPNHGTDVAAVATAFDPSLCDAACRDLRPRSALLAAMNRGDETRGDVSYTSIFSSSDVVSPEATAALTGARNVLLQDVCSGAVVGHVQLLRDPLVLGLVLDAIGEVQPRDDGSRCAQLRAIGAISRRE